MNKEFLINKSNKKVIKLLTKKFCDLNNIKKQKIINKKLLEIDLIYLTADIDSYLYENTILKINKKINDFVSIYKKAKSNLEEQLILDYNYYYIEGYSTVNTKNYIYNNNININEPINTEYITNKAFEKLKSMDFLPKYKIYETNMDFEIYSKECLLIKESIDLESKIYKYINNSLLYKFLNIPNSKKVLIKEDITKEYYKSNDIKKATINKKRKKYIFTYVLKASNSKYIFLTSLMEYFSLCNNNNYLKSSILTTQNNLFLLNLLINYSKCICFKKECNYVSIEGLCYFMDNNNVSNKIKAQIMFIIYLRFKEFKPVELVKLRNCLNSNFNFINFNILKNICNYIVFKKGKKFSSYNNFNFINVFLKNNYVNITNKKGSNDKFKNKNIKEILNNAKYRNKKDINKLIEYNKQLININEIDNLLIEIFDKNKIIPSKTLKDTRYSYKLKNLLNQIIISNCYKLVCIVLTKVIKYFKTIKRHFNINYNILALDFINYSYYIINTNKYEIKNNKELNKLISTNLIELDYIIKEFYNLTLNSIKNKTINRFSYYKNQYFKTYIFMINSLLYMNKKYEFRYSFNFIKLLELGKLLKLVENNSKLSYENNLIVYKLCILNTINDVYINNQYITYLKNNSFFQFKTLKDFNMLSNIVKTNSVTNNNNNNLIIDYLTIIYPNIKKNKEIFNELFKHVKELASNIDSNKIDIYIYKYNYLL